MQGAKEYCSLFKKAEQFGRLYILPHYHARGKTFRIFVLPKDEAVIENGGINAPLNENAVEVYGVIDGQRGWTENYGWIHKGPWCDDFEALCEKKANEIRIARESAQKQKQEQLNKKQQRIEVLLADY